MFWSKLKAIATAAGVLLAIGVGAGVALAVVIRSDDKKVASTPGLPDVPKAQEPTPAEQFRDLVRRYDLAYAAFGKLGENAKTQAEREAAYKGNHIPEEDFNPRFLALAERYRNDPVAIDALVWILEKTMSYWDGYNRTQGDAIGRTMEILARDYLADARLGALCLKLTYYPSPRRDEFVRTVAQRSSDRVVHGRATLALAQYLKMKGEFVETLKKPSNETEEKTLLGLYGSEYLGQLRAADPAQMLREADKLFARVSEFYGDVAYTLPNGQNSRETLADVARRDRRPRPASSASVGPDQPHEEFRAIDESFRAAVKAADQASDAAQKKAGKTEPDEESVRAYVAAYPKWPDSGMKMWRLAQDSPRHNAAFDALVWLVERGPRFFDSRAERDSVMTQVVDALIRDHLETIAEHLTDRNVAMALNFGEQLPAPYREWLLRALFEQGRDRPTRGRMGLALGRYLKAEADCLERMIRPGAPNARRPRDLLFLDPAFADQLRKADRQAIAHQAEDVLKRVIADYGDVMYLNGQVATTEKLAAVAELELTEIRSISVGQTAPEIIGEDAFGKPMKLSEFRGKVVLLDFGSHEHCGACRMVYPRMRATLDRLRDRPFVILGINNHDHREAIKEAIAHREITWRCWWDSAELDGSGPITTRWNVRGYPTFFLIDHRGVIRSKGDTHPFDPSFDSTIESLLKEAEADHLHK